MGWVHRPGCSPRHTDSVIRNYEPEDTASATGYRRPPRAAGCVLDYFHALGFLEDDGDFATSEMECLINRPEEFFGCPTVPNAAVSAPPA